MAQFCTAYNILSTYPHIKYVTMLDDDTLVPDCTYPRLCRWVLARCIDRCVCLSLCVCVCVSVSVE
jgi:hypothetical protein